MAQRVTESQQNPYFPSGSELPNLSVVNIQPVRTQQKNSVNS